LASPIVIESTAPFEAVEFELVKPRRTVQRAGVVDERLNRSKTGNGLFEGLDYIGLARHVALECHRLGAQRPTAVDDDTCRLSVDDVRDGDVVAALGSHRRCGCTDAAAPAGDQHDWPGVRHSRILTGRNPTSSECVVEYRRPRA
jgi:hypothetical protein